MVSAACPHPGRACGGAPAVRVRRRVDYYYYHYYGDHHRIGKPASGLEPLTPSLRVKCSTS